MSLQEIIHRVNKDILEEDMYPASLIKTTEDKEEYERLIGDKLVLYEEVKRVAEALNCNPELIYFTRNAFGSYCYYKFPVIVWIRVMSLKELKFSGLLDTISEEIHHKEEFLSKAMEEGDYRAFFASHTENLHILGLQKIYWRVPAEKRYKFFEDIYTSVDYGFSRIPGNIIEDAIKNRPVSVVEDVKNRLNEISESEEIVIYRGQGDSSTSLDKAMSWTLNLYVASRFASFYTGEGEVYQAKVKKTDVINYLTDRNEEEILVKPEKIYDVENLNMVSTGAELDNLMEGGAVAKYHYYLSQFDEQLFENPKGVHGLTHMKRVLLHTISLIDELELDDFDNRILCYAAQYHDIGRTNDMEDPYHGDKSWEKVVELDLLSKRDYYVWEEIDEYDTDILEFIIRNHCLNDNVVWENLRKSAIEEKDRAEYLMKIFKDADNLDRVRFNDLNPKYLRLEESKRRLNFAFGLWRGVR